ncbi:unnamed protein product [Phytophthora fragariaefolia]|uniref:Unnamed protein product n=1 Tax=Phytophthora fragariaefolia TaxID=1490495 RepID=A0A9W6Y6H6_9STRA|nr:unnamed protein product [Phytophthora fragariaefolia]
MWKIGRQMTINTEVEFVPPGITGISQSTDVAHHMMNDFPSPHPPKQAGSDIPRRGVAWNAIPNEVIARGFIKAGIIPVGPWDASDRVRVSSVDSADAPVVCAEVPHPPKQAGSDIPRRGVAWNAIPNEVIARGFIKAGIIPVGPWDASDRVRVSSVDSADAPVVCAEV